MSLQETVSSSRSDKLLTSWSHLYMRRREVFKSYPDFWKIKVKKKTFQVILETIKKAQSSGNELQVLDVGSSNRYLGTKLKETFPGIQYESMDIDREHFHDYYSMDDIQKKYDMIFSSEVIEHLTFEEGIEMLSKTYQLLKVGGKLIVSTPNLFHPNRYWEYSHKVSYRYDELGGILLTLGYKINHIYRIYNDAFLKRCFRLWVAAPLHQYLCVDFAKSILLVAEKSTE